MEGRKPFRIALPALMTVILLATAVTGYAWMKTDKSANVKLGADNTPEVSIAMASFDPGTKGYKWGNFQKVGKNHETSGAFGGEFNVNQPNTHFGQIENLTGIDDSNRVWFCLKIHEEEGRKFNNLRLHYSEPAYQFYGSEWTDGAQGALKPADQHADREKIHAALGKITDDVMKQLMIVHRPTDQAAFISNAAPSGNWTAPAVDGKIDDYIRLAGDTAGGGLAGTAKNTDNDGCYYVYFQVEPNLDMYYKFVENLYPYMPCYLSFQNLRVTVDVSTVVNETPQA